MFKTADAVKVWLHASFLICGCKGNQEWRVLKMPSTLQAFLKNQINTSKLHISLNLGHRWIHDYLLHYSLYLAEQKITG